MQITELSLDGLYKIEPDVRGDNRGDFAELFNKEQYRKAGLDLSFVQINQSVSKKDVVRGLHFQWEKPLGKLIRVTRGHAFMVFVDIRKSSDSCGRWVSEDCTAEEWKLVYAPPGFAAGFCAYENGTSVEYYYTAFYNPEGEGSIQWNDSDIGISWPTDNPIVSRRDSQAYTLAEWMQRPESELL